MSQSHQSGPAQWYSAIRFGLGQRKSELKDAEMVRLARTLERLSEAAATAISTCQGDGGAQPEAFADVLQALSND